ncbi:MAG: hypothetical protein QW156_04870 [Candidatus Aenigmatarchaeota archaeon]
MRSIKGIALIPSHSLNDHFYTFESIENFQEVVVPIYVDHDYNSMSIGYARIYYSDQDKALLYEGEVEDGYEEYQHVSVGIYVVDYELTEETKRMVIRKFMIYELSLTNNPAIPFTTLEFEKIKNIIHNTNIKYNMSETPKIPDNVHTNVIIEKLNDYFNTHKTTKFTITKETIDATPFATRNENGLFPIPSTLKTNSHLYTTKGIIDGKNVIFVTATMPKWADFVDGSAPSDATQTISEVSVNAIYTGYRQSVTDLAKSVSKIDLVNELVRLGVVMGDLRLDEKVEIEGETSTNVIYANGKTSESALTTSDILTANDILTISKFFRDNGKVGQIVMFVHPKQFSDLARDSNVLSLHISGNKVVGSEEPIRELNVYGVKVFPSNFHTTGTGAGGITTYRSVAFVEGAIGQGYGDIEVEIWRDGNTLKDVITVKKLVATKILDAQGVVKFISA